MSVAPKVTVVVLNWCNEGETAACLESLAASRYPALSILLVDNGSPDGSGDRLTARFPAIPYLQTGANLGYAGGNNRAFEVALAGGADFVFVLNNDTTVDPECVDLLVSAAQETNAAAVAPQILYYDDPSRVWYGGGVMSRMRALGLHVGENQPIDPHQRRGPTTFLCGCAFLIRADVLRSMRGFDESFFAYAEDVELSIRLLSSECRLVYEPAARVLHRVEPAAPPSPFQIRQRDRNRRRIVRLHYGAAERLKFALWFYPTRLVHALRYAAAADGGRARAIWEGAFGPLDGRPAGN
jgi:GT2 family glycosyltransferase